MGTAAFDIEGPVLGEVFVVFADATGVHLSGPCGPTGWGIEVAAGDDPMIVVHEVVRRVLGDPILLHSTSWRRAKTGVMLSFLAVVSPSQVESFEAVGVGRSELARGSESAAPTAIAEAQVLEHALRHLSWLAKDDEVVARALDDDWRAALEGYVPEPFRALS
jgi:hypothetical protein